MIKKMIVDDVFLQKIMPCGLRPVSYFSCSLSRSLGYVHMSRAEGHSANPRINNEWDRCESPSPRSLFPSLVLLLLLPSWPPCLVSEFKRHFSDLYIHVLLGTCPPMSFLPHFLPSYLIGGR